MGDGVRLSTSYSRLAGTNSSRIGLASVAAGRRFWIGDRYVNASRGAAAQSGVRVAIATTMGPIVTVTENAAEPVRNVGTAVLVRRPID